MEIFQDGELEAEVSTAPTSSAYRTSSAAWGAPLFAVH